MAPRRLDGWEPETLIEYGYDDDGRVAWSLEHPEPEFDDEQVAWLIAYARIEADLGSHGHPMSEATSPRADPNNYEGGYRYVTDAPITDYAMKSRLDRIDAWKAEAGENANLNGLVFHTRRVDDLPLGE